MLLQPCKSKREQTLEFFHINIIDLSLRPFALPFTFAGTLQYMPTENELLI